MMLRTGEYSFDELQVIAHTMNTLGVYTEETEGITINSHHSSRFYNTEHYIDYHETLEKYIVFKKAKDWRKAETNF